MRSEDSGLLAQVTTALNNLRAQGNPIGVDIRQVTMTIHGSNPVIYSWDDTNNDWNIVVQ